MEANRGMVSIKVRNGEKVAINRSKSMVIRQLIASYLYEGRLLEVYEEDAKDVKIVSSCLQQLRENKPSPSSLRTIIDVQDCGAAYRFFTAVLAVTPGKWLLTGTERLRQRPILPLVQALQSIGADIADTAEGLLISGKMLHAQTLYVDCTLSSQFASALYMIAPRLNLQNLHIYPVVPASNSYILITRYIVDNILKNNRIENESDWSNAVFWYLFLAASKKHNNLLLSDLKLSSWQGDSIVAKWFEMWGIHSVQTTEGVRIEKVEKLALQQWSSDFSQHIDLAPVMAVSALLLHFDLTMSGVENLDRKESKRLTNLCDALSPYVPIQRISAGEIKIFGSQFQNISNATHCFFVDNDHRLVMAYTLLSLVMDVHLSDIQCVEKSYPQLLKYMEIR